MREFVVACIMAAWVVAMVWAIASGLDSVVVCLLWILIVLPAASVLVVAIKGGVVSSVSPALERIARRHLGGCRHPWARHVAIVLRAGNIISVACNHETVHAEEQALHNLWPSERRGTRLVSVRVTSGGALAEARPCPRCRALMESCGVRSVEYTDHAGRWQVERV